MGAKTWLCFASPRVAQRGVALCTCWLAYTGIPLCCNLCGKRHRVAVVRVMPGNDGQLCSWNYHVQQRTSIQGLVNPLSGGVRFLPPISASPSSPSCELDAKPVPGTSLMHGPMKANGKGPGLTWTSGTVLGPILPSIRSRIFCASRGTETERFNCSALLHVGLPALLFYRWAVQVSHCCKFGTNVAKKIKKTM